MGKNTPPLQDKKGEYIEKHLFNELRYLLAAATEWAIQEQLQFEKAGYEVQVYAMDSAFLHARSLFEFLTAKTTDNHYGYDEFLKSPLDLSPYTKDRMAPLHHYVMHTQDRSKPGPLTAADGTSKDLNKMPVEFGHEILRLWRRFELALSATGDPNDKKFEELAVKKREEAIKAAATVIESQVAKQHAKEKGETLKPIFTP
jgi:hypothetical protein